MLVCTLFTEFTEMQGYTTLGLPRAYWFLLGLPGGGGWSYSDRISASFADRAVHLDWALSTAHATAKWVALYQEIFIQLDLRFHLLS